MNIGYKPKFVRRFNKLEPDLQEEVLKTIELLLYTKNHKSLKVHKLGGKLKTFFSCSVNYSYRIIFFYESKKDITLVTVGNHEVYK